MTENTECCQHITALQKSHDALTKAVFMGKGALSAFIFFMTIIIALSGWTLSTINRVDKHQAVIQIRMETVSKELEKLRKQINYHEKMVRDEHSKR
jgi:hypothetical protein